MLPFKYLLNNSAYTSWSDSWNSNHLRNCFRLGVENPRIKRGDI